MKRKIRLTESDLHRIVNESVKRMLNEIGDTERGQYMLGRLDTRKSHQDPRYDNSVSNYAGSQRYNNVYARIMSYNLPEEETQWLLSLVGGSLSRGYNKGSSDMGRAYANQNRYGKNAFSQEKETAGNYLRGY